MEEKNGKIRKRDGRIVPFDKAKITDAIFNALEDVGKPDYDLAKELSEEVVTRLEDRLDSDELPEVEQVQDLVEEVLMDKDQAGVAKSYILYRQERTEIRKEKQQILEKEEIDEVDKKFDLNALRVLKSRYLKKDPSGNLIETPKELFERVATHVTLPSLLYDQRVFDKENEHNNEESSFNPKELAGEVKIGEYPLNEFHLRGLKRTYDRLNEKGKMRIPFSEVLELLKEGGFNEYQEEIESYYDLMVERKFLPNTPALANFGDHLGMGSACFVLDIHDSLESIMNGLKKAAVIFKSGGGVGYNFSELRPEGDYIRSTGGKSSGPISFMSLFDKMTDVVKQGGIRRGASIGILDCDHPDIVDFVKAKKGNETLNNFNISIFLKNDFWKHLKKDKPYPLKNPRTEEVVDHVDPDSLLDLISYQAWESAEPGVIFQDEVNKNNPFLEEWGPIKATNPCVTDDTWVMTPEGPRQVKELVGERTEVIVDGKKWSNSGKGFFNTGVKPIYEVKTKEGFELSLTGNHPLKKIKNLTRYKLEFEWEEAENLKPGDKVILNSHSDLEWDGEYGEKEGYLMGHFVGDGTMTKKKFILESWGDSEGEKKVRSVIEKLAESFPHRSDFQGWQSYPEQGKYRLALSSLKDLAEKLEVDKNKEITSAIERNSSEFYKGFIRGLFDTDGSVQGSQEKGVSIRLSQSNLRRLKVVQRMLLRLGIFSKIYTDRREAGEKKLPDGKGGYKSYNIKSQHELVISNENILTFYERVGFENSEKLNKLKSLLDDYKRKLNKERFVAEVEEVKPLGKEEKVYDIQVPGVNAFDANGFYVHNCGEIPLYPGGSCNLGSINVWNFIEKENHGKKRKVEVNWEELKETIRIATRFLDNVIDVNRYPLPEIEDNTLNVRKTGLGIMGLGDLLYEIGLPYDSKKGRSFMEKLSAFINYHSKVQSVKLAKERGSFPAYEESFYIEGKLPFEGKKKWKEWAPGGLNWKKLRKKIKEFGIRNAHTTANAPTGSISMIAGCSSGIEPVYSLVFEKKVTVGSFYYVDPVFEKVTTRKGLFDRDLVKEISNREGSAQSLSYIPDDVKKVFVTSHDIKAEDHIKALASLQKWTDASISKTINFPANATASDIKKAYLLAHKLGCKDLTVFRNKSIKGVLSSGNEEREKSEKKDKKDGLVNLKDSKANGPSIYKEAGVNEEEGSLGQDFKKEEEEKCPKCKTKLIYKEGCKKCPNCGWGACTT